MIKYSSGVIVEIEKDKQFKVDDSDEYKSFLIYLTDPKIVIKREVFEVDTSITDPLEKSICNNYKDFFLEFLELRTRAIADGRKEVEELTVSNDS